MYQPKTGQPCHCHPGVQRDNCPDCEGTGQRIDFAAVRRKFRRGNAIVTETVEPTTVDYADVVAAGEIEPDDSGHGAPWEECDGWEHDTERYAPHDDAERSDRWVSRSSREGGSIWLTLDVEKSGIPDYAYFRAQGMSKQVARERAAQSLADAYATLHGWYANGWEWWQVSIDFHGYTGSVGGIDDYDYAQRDCVHDVAAQIVSEMERDGYTVIGKPPPYNFAQAKRDEFRRRITYNLTGTWPK